MTVTGASSVWMLDSSTFINTCIISHVPLLVLLRRRLYFPEYVFRIELGSDAHEDTRRQAALYVERQEIGIEHLSLSDLDRIANLEAPRRIGLGEIACAIVAERESGGVLSDDHRSRSWLKPRLEIPRWESIEDFLLEAAALHYISEFDLNDYQKKLEANRYVCRFDLRLEHLRRLAFHS